MRTPPLKLICIIPAALSLVLAACERGNDDKSYAAIEAREAEIDAAIKAKDAAKAASVYTDFADPSVLSAPDRRLSNGPNDIRKEYQALADDPRGKLSFGMRLANFSKSGELAYSWGDYDETRTGPDGSTRVWSGTYLRIWLLLNGVWRIKMETRTPLSSKSVEPSDAAQPGTVETPRP